jgi:nitroreductase
VRDYTGEAIPRGDLIKIVDAARVAPSGYNRQPWDFSVVTKPDMIQELRVTARSMENAGAVIAVVVNPSTRFWLEDASAAIENILIAAAALGYGSCWLEGDSLPLEQELKSLLDVPEDRRLLSLITLGVPVSWPTQEKRPLEDVLHWELYGQKQMKER